MGKRDGTIHKSISLLVMSFDKAHLIRFIIKTYLVHTEEGSVI